MATKSRVVSGLSIDGDHTNHTISVMAYNPINRQYDSGQASVLATVVILETPSPSWQASTSNPDQGTLSWNKIAYADKYYIYVDGVNIGSTANLNYLVTGLSLGTHSIGVIAAYTKNENYDSEEGTVSVTTVRLQAPTLSSADGTYVAYTDSAKTKRYQIYRYNADGTVASGYPKDPQCNRLSWLSIPLSGQYRLYDGDSTVVDSIQASSTQVTLTNPQWQYTNETPSLACTVGVHNYKLKSVYPSNEEYNSDFSNIITITIDTLPAPVLNWKNSDSTQSFITVSVTGDKADQVDFFELKLQPRYGILGAGPYYGSFDKSGDATEYNSYLVANGHSLLNTNIAINRDDYTITTASNSYNNFYNLNESLSSNALQYYSAYQLTAPTSLSYDYATQTLTFVGDDKATNYSIRIYTGSTTNPVLSSEITSTSTTVPLALAAGFWIIKVTANNSGNNSQNPYIISSLESSPLAVGTLIAPVISRSEQYLNWNSVQNANTYLVYDNGVQIAQIAATSLSSVSYNMQNIGLGSHSIYVVATATIDNVLYKSANSNTVTFTIVKLATPSIQFSPAGSSVVTWNAIANADYYDIFVNGTLEKTVTVGTLTYTVSKDDAAIYNITVVARNNDTFLYNSSSQSNHLQYNVIKLAPPTGLIYDKDADTITWTASANAVSTTVYKVYVNNSLVATTAELTFSTASYTTGSYGVYIIASDSGTSQYPNPKYLNSEKSVSVTFGKLATPVLTVNDNVITWPAIPNAAYYEIYNYDQDITSTMATQYVIQSTSPASFYISVLARSSDASMDDSDRSNYVSVTISQLAAPVISLNSDTLLLSWLQIQNADFYEIYINGQLSITTSNINASLKAKLPEGSRSFIYVVAVSNKAIYLDSAHSNAISAYISSTSSYLVKVGDESYGLNLPFTINNTLDDTLDSAFVTTIPITRKEPFEAYSNCEIMISDEGQQQKTMVIQKNRPYDFILDSDTVEEVQMGDQSMFKHHLSLIEHTKLLETYILPNFSITQKLDIVLSDYRRRSSNSVSANTSYLDSSGKIVTLQPWNTTLAGMYSGSFDKSWGEYSGNFRRLSNLSFNIPVQAIKGYSIQLPMDVRQNPGTQFFFKDQKKYLNFWGQSGISYGRYWIGDSIPMMHWYIRHNDRSDTESADAYAYRKYTETISGNANYTEIASTNDCSTPIIYSFNNTGKFDLIYTIDGVTVDTNPNIGDEYKVINGMCTSQTEAFTPLIDILNVTSEKIKSEFNKLKPYRIEWNSIEITETPTLGTMERGTLTVLDALVKTIDVVNNQYYDVYSKLSAPHFTLDKELFGDYSASGRSSNKYDNIECPEMTFEKGKSLWDVLLELGRLIGGIPRLLPGNIITFDILKDIAYPINEDVSYSPDKTELESSDSQITNHTTGYISQIKNMIPSQSISVYPGSKLWVTPRSQSDSDPYVTRTNMAIVLDKNIFQIIDLKISNFNKQNPSEEMSLIQFLYEKQVFDTLNNDEKGKGLALYWKKGDSKIYGLGIIPQANEMYAAWGWSEDKYVIQNILTSMGYVSLNDVSQFKYRVWFVPYIDNRVFTEQSNIYGLHHDTYLNLNQENNTVTDQSFGKSAQVQVSRLGNNSIQKTLRLHSLESIPRLGAIKVYNNEKYYIDNLQIQFNNTYYDVTANFSKNWNKINDRVGINSEYRQFEIYGSNFVNRTLNLNNYCYVSLNNYGTKLTRATDVLLQDIVDAFNQNPHEQLGYFYIGSQQYYSDGSGNKTLERTKYTEQYVENYEIKQRTVNTTGILLPAAYNTIGNSIMYSCAMKDNFSAGINAINQYNQKYIQKDVRYVDDLGTCAAIRLALCDPSQNQLTTTLGTGDSIFPQCNYISDGSILEHRIFSNQYYVNKDNREALQFSYQMHFQTYDRHFVIHDGLTRYLYKPNSDISLQGAYKIVTGPIIVCGYNGSCKDIDVLQYTQGDILMKSISPVIESNKIRIPGISSTNSIAPYTGYAFVWSLTGEILFNYEYDQPQTISSIPDTYLNFSSDKISYKAQ